MLFSAKKELFVTLTIIVICFFAGSCSNEKKKSSGGENSMDVSQFIRLFKKTEMPVQFSDTMLEKKSRDTADISVKVFNQFVPDTVLAKIFSKNIHPHIYPVGRATDENKTTYLFAKLISGDKREGLIICFDKKNNFMNAMQAMKPGMPTSYKQTCAIDKRFTISKTITRKNSDGSTSEGKDVYSLNESTGNFELIMTDALDENNVELINPIDTVSKKQKFTGDYVKDKKNIVSIRDSKKHGRFMFFVHFEKNSGSCTGELKGEASLTGTSAAVYNTGGDPCQLEFNFTSASVTIRELRGCGSHRGIDCVFEGTFLKRHEIKKPLRKTLH